jgi:hypothetical protein
MRPPLRIRIISHGVVFVLSLVVAFGATHNALVSVIGALIAGVIQPLLGRWLWYGERHEPKHFFRNEVAACLNGPMHGRDVWIPDFIHQKVVRVNGEQYKCAYVGGSDPVLLWIAESTAAEQRERERLLREEHEPHHDARRRRIAAAGLPLAAMAGVGGSASVVMPPPVGAGGRNYPAAP